MNRNPFQLAVDIGWTFKIFTESRKTLLLSDGKTETPYSDRLHIDLEAFEERVRADERAKVKDEAASMPALRNVG